MDSTTETLNHVKARIKTAVEQALYLTETPATVFNPTLRSDHKEALIPVTVPRAFASLAITAYAVESSFTADVEIRSIGLATCECYELVLRADVDALLAVVDEQESTA